MQKNGGAAVSLMALLGLSGVAEAQQDPGVRGGPPGAGGPISGLTTQQAAAFAEGQSRFNEIDDVLRGLGPRFNLDGCAGCHAQPALGGSSPAKNPQIDVSQAMGASNSLPAFITAAGPVREVRFRSDGGVHALFTIAGRTDAPGCNVAQPDFAAELARGNISLRIPTPTFGAGLVETTSDQTLIDDVAAVADRRGALKIGGHFNHSGNDGTITRFGWKAQNKSMMIFAGEAYNVEQGITNFLFPNERDNIPNCQFTAKPEDQPDFGSTAPITQAADDVTMFAAFMGALAAPSAAPDSPSIQRGRQAFVNVGCDTCHIPSHKTSISPTGALNQITYSPYSDFQVHDMGSGLADGISQGEAGSSEFRTAPLWGVGQRLFFLHDGSTSDLLVAIQAHDDGSNGAGGPHSEANRVVRGFNALAKSLQQDVLNFLRSL